MSLPASPAHSAVDRILVAVGELNLLDSARLSELADALQAVVYSLTGPNPAHVRTDPLIPVDNRSLVYRFRTGTLPHKYRLTIKDDTDPQKAVVFEKTLNFTDPNLLSFDVPATYDDPNGVTRVTFTAGHEYFFFIQGMADVGGMETAVGQRQLVAKRAISGGATSTGLLALLELIELLRAQEG